MRNAPTTRNPTPRASSATNSANPASSAYPANSANSAYSTNSAYSPYPANSAYPANSRLLRENPLRHPANFFSFPHCVPVTPVNPSSHSHLSPYSHTVTVPVPASDTAHRALAEQLKASS